MNVQFSPKPSRQKRRRRVVPGPILYSGVLVFALLSAAAAIFEIWRR